MEMIKSDFEKRNNFESYRMASTFGLIMGLAISAIHFIFYLLEGKINSSFAVTVLTLIAVIIVIYKATVKYRNVSGGYISYWNAFVYGVKIFLFAGIIGAVYSYVFSNIDPDYAYRQIELIRQPLLNAEFASAEIVDKMISTMKEDMDYQMQHPFQSALSAILWNTFSGALFCFISSAFLRKNKPETINES
ncbi:MAG: DUF4199 domain-containing protein [Prevotellaceae bacterium]|nr:DUF4199 domain-containing protein [Prevotellaceae bacterium]